MGAQTSQFRKVFISDSKNDSLRQGIIHYQKRGWNIIQDGDNFYFYNRSKKYRFITRFTLDQQYETFLIKGI